MGRKKAITAPPKKSKPFKIAGRVMPLGDRDKQIREAIERIDLVYNKSVEIETKLEGNDKIYQQDMQLKSVSLMCKILGLEAPTKMQIQNESMVTVVDRTHQALLSDPVYRKQLMRLEQHAIDITGEQTGATQGVDADGSGAPGDGTTLEVEASPPDDQRSPHGRRVRPEPKGDDPRRPETWKE